MMKGKTQMNKLKDLVELIGDDGDIIAVNEDTLLELDFRTNFFYDAIAGSTDCFYDLNLDKGKYILFKAIGLVTIDGETND